MDSIWNNLGRVKYCNSVDINEAQSRVQQLLDSLVDLNSTTANHIQRIDENFLRLMFRTVSFFGLAR